MAIPFVVIELDKPYNLRFGMGSQIEYEKLSKKTIPELGKEMQTGLSVTTLNTVLFVMLKKEIKDLTLEQVSNLVDEYADNIPYITEKVCEAINAAYETKLPNEEPPEVSQNG
jgi:uncharacterized spore protein YtfJ